MSSDPYQKVSDDYNKLPFDTRVIAGRVLMTTQIRQLHLEKERLKKMYRKSLAEINDHIRNIESDLEKEIRYSEPE